MRTAFLYDEITAGFQGYRLGRYGTMPIAKGAIWLRQSSGVWNNRFSSFLNAYNLVSASADGCVYCSTTVPRLIITIFVDDGMVICVEDSHVGRILCYIEKNI